MYIKKVRLLSENFGVVINGFTAALSLENEETVVMPCGARISFDEIESMPRTSPLGKVFSKLAIIQRGAL